eukprot:gene7972-7372_t
MFAKASIVAAWVATALGAVSAGRAALPKGHLKIMMFYDFNLTAQHAFSNVASGDGASLQDMVQAHTKYGMQGMPELPPTIFDRAHHTVFPDWEDKLDAWLGMLRPGFVNGTFLGVFLGDEICCSGVPTLATHALASLRCLPLVASGSTSAVSPVPLEDLTKVADALRTALGPDPVLYTNECSVMGKWPSVPASLDYISIDFYD